ncbi:MAG: glycosyltransferase family 2 protein [Candidatus Caenarcaniphilales bacterium]|nr:glycosyltransferase family 2 protein [Candidatus Caenarcaniphilales bacterium]
MNYKNSAVLLSIVIPCFNERERLPKTLNKILSYLNSSQEASIIPSWEIIVVDSASTDGTASLIDYEFREIVKVIKLKVKEGKGKSVKVGVLSSLGENVLICDADGSTPICEISKLLLALEKSSIAIGSRKDQSLLMKKQSVYRRFIGRVFNFLVRFITGVNVFDTQCGFKLGKGSELRNLFKKIQIKGFSYDVELLFLANIHKYKISEVPVIWMNDERSSINLWLDPVVMFFELLQIKFFHSFKFKNGN